MSVYVTAKLINGYIITTEQMTAAQYKFDKDGFDLIDYLYDQELLTIVNAYSEDSDYVLGYTIDKVDEGTAKYISNCLFDYDQLIKVKKAYNKYFNGGNRNDPNIIICNSLY